PSATCGAWPPLGPGHWEETAEEEGEGESATPDQQRHLRFECSRGSGTGGGLRTAVGVRAESGRRRGSTLQERKHCPTATSQATVPRCAARGIRNTSSCRTRQAKTPPHSRTTGSDQRNPCDPSANRRLSPDECAASVERRSSVLLSAICRGNHLLTLARVRRAFNTIAGRTRCRRKPTAEFPELP